MLYLLAEVLKLLSVEVVDVLDERQYFHFKF